LKGVFGKYTSGEKDLVQDLKEVLQSSEVSTGDVGGLMLASGIAKWLQANPAGADLLKSLVGSLPKS
jgi:hypothetical protein